MTKPDHDQKKARQEQELRIQRQIAFASGLFQGDVTIRTLLESLIEGVVIIDNSGTILLVNTAAEQMFGYQRKELIGKPQAVLIPGRFRKAHEEYEAGYFAEPVIKQMGRLLNLTGCRRDGSEFPVEISLSFIETVNGVLVLTLVSDITLRRQFEMRLLESEELFHVQVEGIQDYAIFMLDTQGNVLNWNTGAERLKGYRSEEIIGKHFSCFYSEEERSAGKPEAALKKAAAEGRVADEGWRVRKDGSRFWADVLITALCDASGKLRGFSKVTHDITERKRVEDELKITSMQNELILASAGEGIIGLDLEGNQTFINTAAAAMLGHDVNELVGKPSHATWHYARLDGSRYPTEECPIYAAYKDGKLYSGEEVFLRKDGTGFPVQFTSRPIFFDEKIIGAVLTFNDISERKRMEDALRKSEKKFLTVFHAVPAILGITTLAEGRFVDVNETCMRILGYQRDEVIGHTSLELGIWESQADRNKAMRTLEEHGKVRDVEIKLRGKSGDILVGLLSAEFIEIDGELYILSMINDITERKRMEEEIERLNTELAARAVDLEVVNQELEAFNYTVAHDLRKPLTVVNGYCQALKELCADKLDDACMGYLREAYEGTWRMNRLIDALLNFSRLAHIETRRETVNLSAMAHEVVSELKLAEPERRITFRIVKGIRAEGDTALLRVVLDNLLGNAWKYTGRQEEAVVEFGITEISGIPVYFVRDNGAGFDMAEADKLFVPFQCLPGAEECRGFGIGLATVERIVRRHGGKVWAEGELGKGSTFYFTLLV